MTTEEQLKEIVKKYDLKNKTREHEYRWKRQYFTTFCRGLGYTYTQCGSFVGQNHATVINSEQRVDDMLNTKDLDFAIVVKDIAEDLEKVTPPKVKLPGIVRNPIVETINKLFEVKNMEDVEELKKYVMENIDKNRLK